MSAFRPRLDRQRDRERRVVHRQRERRRERRRPERQAERHVRIEHVARALRDRCGSARRSTAHRREHSTSCRSCAMRPAPAALESSHVATGAAPKPFAAIVERQRCSCRDWPPSGRPARLAGARRGRRAPPRRSARRRPASTPARTAVPSAPGGNRSRNAPIRTGSSTRSDARTSRSALSPAVNGATAALSPPRRHRLARFGHRRA